MGKRQEQRERERRRSRSKKTPKGNRQHNRKRHGRKGKAREETKRNTEERKRKWALTRELTPECLSVFTVVTSLYWFNKLAFYDPSLQTHLSHSYGTSLGVPICVSGRSTKKTTGGPLIFQDGDWKVGALSGKVLLQAVFRCFVFGERALEGSFFLGF